MTTNTTSIDATRDALMMIRSLTTHTDANACTTSMIICIHEKCDAALRDIMLDLDRLPTDLDDDPYSISHSLYTALRDAYAMLLDSPYHRDDITELALSQSLCPIHFCDYAICFDDDNPDCAQIRMIHPSHDT